MRESRLTKGELHLNPVEEVTLEKLMKELDYVKMEMEAHERNME